MTRAGKIPYIISKLFFITVFFLLLNPLFSESIYDPTLNYSFDIPEGYVLSDYSDDGMSLLFEHPGMPVTYVIKVYDAKEYKNCPEALSAALTKLSAKGDVDPFKWSKKNCAISYFEMTLDKEYSGWAVSAPVGNDEFILVSLCYCPATYSSKCSPFIISTINSLCINPDFYYEPGIITSYAYPSEGKKNINLNIGKYQINTSIDNIDSEAAQFIVDLEFNVLTLYANHQMKIDAWKRFYRMIYRDSYGRLKNVNADIKKTIYPAAKKINPENPDLEYAATLLSWIQNFEYKRDNEKKTSSDFTNLPGVLEGTGNDCDSRSMLLCVLMNYINKDSILLFSQAYSHAMVAIDLDAQGQKYEVVKDEGSKEYIMGETTAKVTLGMIAQNHADRSKWYFVEF